jgi:hypothetical protein
MIETSKQRGYVSDWRTVGAYYVHRYSILSTDRVVYAVYEPMTGVLLDSSHSSMMTHPELGRWVGQVSSRRLPAEVDAIPVGPARWDAIDALRAAQAAECFNAIVGAYPEAARGEFSANRCEFEGTLEQARLS